MTRLTSPRFSSRSPSRISCPIFRFALRIIDFLTNLPQDMGRNAVSHVLRVHRQHPDDPVRSPYVIDDAIAATLASARSSPAQLADTSRPGDHRASLWISDQRGLQRHI